MKSRISPNSIDLRTMSWIWLGLGTALLFFIGSAFLTYRNTSKLSQDAKTVTHTHEVITALMEVLSLAKDAETGQRGFVITGDERYLAPYTTAVGTIHTRLSEIEKLTQDNIEQQARVPQLRAWVDSKLNELDETIQLRRGKGFEDARAVVVSDRGKAAMDGIRDNLKEMEVEERRLRAQRMQDMETAYQVAVISGILTAIFGAAISMAVAYLVQRSLLARQREQWLQSGRYGVNEATVGDPEIQQLGHATLRFLAEYLDAQAGALYTLEGGTFRIVSTYGVPPNGKLPQQFDWGQGLLGQAAKDNHTFIVRDVPEGYLTIGSSLGQSLPRHLLIGPMAADGKVNAVLELGFIHPLEDSSVELLQRVSEYLGIAVRSANYRAHLRNLLEETQRQSEELQSQSEELRVSNEELEEQGRALRESQNRLELQQTELEQTNSQLEEQTQLLETQRDDVNRSRLALQAQANELEQASQYKSDFLANMSHELRTPLNSSLILAKLLADNPTGNLTDEQVRYADTIRSAGNDLLALINDILDLSKIEAGHMEVHPESVRLSQIVTEVEDTFHAVAQHKGLQFRTHINDDCPTHLETDRMRLQQILKNLLSNALKFTEAGHVELTINRAPAGQVSFHVRDTGIGIPVHQQQIIFEAFRQADGTTNRRFGGTGLGLSISRELTRLLGGEIHLVSEPGQGSTFTITVPEQYDPTRVKPRISISKSTTPHTPSASFTSQPAGRPVVDPPRIETTAKVRARRVEDDREQLKANGRIILAVEDDEAFARIIYDLAHESNFQCLIANSAEEGLAIAIQYLPNAVILDVGLPDNSGLSVLDRLKHDSRTRHIPVHVVSASDYSQTAMSLGAVGYMLKPVQREELVKALQQLETKFSQRMRRVLVVEDDPVQLDSMQRLLRSSEVETVGAQTAAECLANLKEATFDCMVLDLSLPDASGYSLLETLSREDTYSFPPVIVYTGRELSTDEEERLRRYSKSIIIKGAKSPERLLDEVTLFLHQVESDLPAEQQRMLEKARSRDAALEGRHVLVVEDDVRNVFALTSLLEPRGAVVKIARNGREALQALERSREPTERSIDLVLMDVMMPEMDGITATREIRSRPEWMKLPIIMLTAKAMKDDQERCLGAGANDYMAKPLDVDKLLSLVRVWMPR
jgi:signal transduction histidine kinase/DNA-binding response OmpR family regulator/CHASE3 domain sensor protein